MRAVGHGRERSGGTRRQLFGTALAGLILGLGGVTIGTSLVQASERGGLAGFFEALFGRPTETVAAPPAPVRHTTLPSPRRFERPRVVVQTPRPDKAHSPVRRRPATRLAAAQTKAPAPDAWSGKRTVCVRMCDGYLFPLGNLRGRGDLLVHAASCAAACPGAATSLYTLSGQARELDEAVSPQGLPYKATALANLYRTRRVADCSCQPAVGAAPLPIARDPTLERNDIVATRDSARVVVRARSGGYALEDYRSARIPRAYARQIEARVGAEQRDAQAHAFRVALRAGAQASVIRVAAAGPGMGFQVAAPGTGAFGTVRVVAPSPFLR